MDGLMDTAAETARDDEDNDAEPQFTSDERWLGEFENQLTAKLVDSLRGYARMRALAVGYAGRKVDDYYARELVQDAIGDTWEGVLTWAPDRCSLEHHLVRAIQSRAHKDRGRAHRHAHDAIGDATPASELAEAEASSQVADNQTAERRLYAMEMMGIIRDEAAADAPVLRILEAYDAGAQTKDDVICHARMKARTYHNAHMRLRRIVRKLADNTLAFTTRA